MTEENKSMLLIGFPILQPTYTVYLISYFHFLEVTVLTGDIRDVMMSYVKHWHQGFHWWVWWAPPNAHRSFSILTLAFPFCLYVHLYPPLTLFLPPSTNHGTLTSLSARYRWREHLAPVPYSTQHPQAVQPPAERLLCGQGRVPQPQCTHERSHSRLGGLWRPQAGQDAGQQDAEGAQRRLQ